MQEFFRLVAEHEDFSDFTPREFYAADDKVFVLGNYSLRLKTNGTAIASEWVHVFTLKNGKVARFREHTDTAKFAEGSPGRQVCARPPLHREVCNGRKLAVADEFSRPIIAYHDPAAPGPARAGGDQGRDRGISSRRQGRALGRPLHGPDRRYRRHALDRERHAHRRTARNRADERRSASTASGCFASPTAGSSRAGIAGTRSACCSSSASCRRSARRRRSSPKHTLEPAKPPLSCLPAAPVDALLSPTRPAATPPPPTIPSLPFRSPAPPQLTPLPPPYPYHPPPPPHPPRTQLNTHPPTTRPPPPPKPPASRPSRTLTRTPLKPLSSPAPPFGP